MMLGRNLWIALFVILCIPVVGAGRELSVLDSRVIEMDQLPQGVTEKLLRKNVFRLLIPHVSKTLTIPKMQLDDGDEQRQLIEHLISNRWRPDLRAQSLQEQIDFCLQSDSEVCTLWDSFDVATAFQTEKGDLMTASHAVGTYVQKISISDGSQAFRGYPGLLLLDQNLEIKKINWPKGNVNQDITWFAINSREGFEVQCDPLQQGTYFVFGLPDFVPEFAGFSIAGDQLHTAQGEFVTPELRLAGHPLVLEELNQKLLGGFFFNANTLPGMSGSPVLDENGCVAGVLRGGVGPAHPSNAWGSYGQWLPAELRNEDGR